MDKQTQCFKVVNHIKLFGSINCSQAFHRYGIAALHSRIADLRTMGYPVRKVRQEYFDEEGNLRKGWAYVIDNQS